LLLTGVLENKWLIVTSGEGAQRAAPCDPEAWHSASSGGGCQLPRIGPAPTAGTTSQQRSILPAAGRGAVFQQGSKPRSKKCSPAGATTLRVCRMADPTTLI